MNRAQHITSLFEYEGEKKPWHKVAGVGLGAGALLAGGLAAHAAYKGQSFGTSLHGLGHYLSPSTAHAPGGTTGGGTTVHHYPKSTVVTGKIAKELLKAKGRSA